MISGCVYVYVSICLSTLLFLHININIQTALRSNRVAMGAWSLPTILPRLQRARVPPVLWRQKILLQQLPLVKSVGHTPNSFWGAGCVHRIPALHGRFGYQLCSSVSKSSWDSCCSNLGFTAPCEWKLVLATSVNLRLLAEAFRLRNSLLAMPTPHGASSRWDSLA